MLISFFKYFTRNLTIILLISPAILQAQKTAIKVDPTTSLRPINPGIYGINQRWFDYDISLWNDENSKLHQNYKEVGLASFRYPAGTAAGAFEWKKAIGPKEKRSVIEGHTWIERNAAAKGTDYSNGGRAMPADFGLDEALRFCEKTNSTFIYMYNFGTGSAADAAELVEYLNAPEGTNPNGGIDWAKERAKNGHAKPYHVKFIEMGNEMYERGQQHYWLEGRSKHDHNYKYCFGDTVFYTKQRVGDLDAQSQKAAFSSRSPDQIKYIRYRPILPNSATIYVGSKAWERVKDLRTAGAQNVYTLDENTGKITFGNGRQGNLPLENDSAALITASYQAARDGFDDHYRAIKSVDPSIKVLSSLVHNDFIQTMGTSPYDGVAMHPYAGFWNLPKSESVENYHDLVMLNSDEEADSSHRILAFMKKHVGEDRKDKVQVIITEYGIALGTIAAQYQSSIDQALYTGRIVSAAIELGMPLTSKHSIASVIGSAPHFIITPTGYLFKLYSRMFGSTHIPSQVINNPTRKTVTGEKLPKLHVISSKDSAGYVYVMVLNRDRADAVTADIELNKYALTKGKATVWTLSAPAFTAFNTPENPNNVSIKESIATAKGNVLTHTFPAFSITAIKISGKPK